eukprot:1180292-Prorocentrum_minimum.AAC.2
MHPASPKQPSASSTVPPSVGDNGARLAAWGTNTRHTYAILLCQLVAPNKLPLKLRASASLLASDAGGDLVSHLLVHNLVVVCHLHLYPDAVQVLPEEVCNATRVSQAVPPDTRSNQIRSDQIKSDPIKSDPIRSNQ